MKSKTWKSWANIFKFLEVIIHFHPRQSLGQGFFSLLLVFLLKQIKGVTTQMKALDEYSQHPLKRHIKADTSLKQTWGVGPYTVHSSFTIIALQGRHLSKADSRSWFRVCPPYRVHSNGGIHVVAEQSSFFGPILYLIWTEKQGGGRVK